MLSKGHIKRGALLQKRTSVSENQKHSMTGSDEKIREL